MAEDHSIGGSDRRTFLRAMMAAGALGASGAVGTAAAQDGGSYLETLRGDLEDGEGLPAGEFVYGTSEDAWLDAFGLQGPDGGSAEQFAVEDDAVPITQGLRATISEDAEDDWTYTIQGFVEDSSFEVGDVLLGVVYTRSDDGEAQTQANFKYRYTDANGETAYQSGSFVAEAATIQPSGEWTRHYLPIEVGEKPEGSDHTPYMEFWLGFAQQTVAFGGIALVDYSDADVAVGDLPAGSAESESDSDSGSDNPLLDYEGREEGAQWRQDARDRIQDIRTADLDVTVVDENGDSVPGATVEAAMTEHAFPFGSAVAASRINGDSEDDATYRETFLEDFNRAVVENGLKYPSFLGPWGDSKDGAIQTLEWLDDNDVPARGHYLVWEEAGTDGGGGMAVDDADSMSDSELQSTLVERIENHADDVGDLVDSWDMHNHPIWQPNFRSEDGRGLGWDAVLEWWEAGDGTTDLPLYTNEMGNVAGDDFRSQHLDLVERLVDDGAPVDGAGFMGHVQFPNGNVTPPMEMLDTYDDFAETGLPILITEFDVQIETRDNAEQVDWQTDFVRDFLVASFSHEAVEGLLSWGFWAGEHWRPTAAYYDEDWTLRPHGEQYVDLVFDEWWTEEDLETGDDGTAAVTGFEGAYEITASADGESASTTADLGDDGASVELTLEGVDAGGSGDDGGTHTSDGTEPTGGDGPGMGVGSALAGAGGLGGYAWARQRGDDEPADESADKPADESS